MVRGSGLVGMLAALMLVLAGCGAATGTPMAVGGAGGAPSASGRSVPGGATPTAGATPAGTTTPPASGFPAGQRPPRPVPDPNAVAAGSALRATLLLQLAEYEREVARCASVGTPIVSCNVTGFEAVQPRSPELAAYMGWYSFIRQCASDGKGGFVATAMFIYSSPEELREPGLLDVYVANAPWCGSSGGATVQPSARPVPPGATPTVSRSMPGPSVAPAPAPTLPRIPTVQGAITKAATARGVTPDRRPDRPSSEFAVRDDVFITYTARNVGAGHRVAVRLYRDGQTIPLEDTEVVIDRGGTYYGYSTYRPLVAGAYRIELYFNGKATPDQTVMFTVR